MTTLADALASLAGAPTVKPTPVALIERRSNELRRRRRVRLLAGAGAGALAVAIPIAVGTARTDRAINVTTTTPADVRNAEYIAAGPGGYLGTGHWSLTIHRGPTVLQLRSDLDQPCGPTGTIQPGDRVFGTVSGTGSALRAGEAAHC